MIDNSQLRKSKVSERAFLRLVAPYINESMLEWFLLSIGEKVANPKWN